MLKYSSSMETSGSIPLESVTFLPFLVINFLTKLSSISLELPYIEE